MAVEQLRRKVPGGIGAYARGLLRGLTQCAEMGESVDLTLLASRQRGRWHGGSSDHDPIEAFGRPIVLSALPSRLLTRAWDHGWWRLPPGFDVVHSVSLASPPHRADGHSRSVVTVHDVAWRRHPEATTRRGRQWHETALCRARDSGASLVVTSELVSADLIADGVDPSRITIVHGGSDHLVPEDVTGTDRLLTQLGVKGEYLLTVSTLEPRKNVSRLLAAFHQIRDSLSSPTPLVIVGPTGWGPALPSPEHQEGVVFAGAVNDAVLSGLYRRARAFAYVPLTEGYGLPPLEAMRLGTPSVVSNEVPSVHDLGQPDPAPARIVNPEDVDDIAAGLFAVLTDENLRRDLTRRGTDHSMARTWRSAAEDHIRLWDSLA
jgi:glycosyltransferase involved in cell wall biosynthesis